MKVAITGATGFVGTSLVSKLQEQGDEIIVLTRNVERAKQVFPSQKFPQVTLVSYSPGSYTGTEISQCQAVVNLAGQPIAERWSKEYKEEVLNSRQLVTSNLVKLMGEANPKPQVLVNASAIGYYGTSETASYDENSPPGQDFLAQVCQTWEAEAKKVTELGVRLVILRFGIVLGDGGALAKMINPFKLFAGGPIGTGRQWVSWIHIDDLLNLNLPNKRIYNFTNSIIKGNESYWTKEIFEPIASYCLNYFSYFDKESLPNTAEIDKKMEISLIRKIQNKKLGTKFIKVDRLI